MFVQDSWYNVYSQSNIYFSEGRQPFRIITIYNVSGVWSIFDHYKIIQLLSLSLGLFGIFSINK